MCIISDKKLTGLKQAIFTSCKQCGSICCKEYYPMLLATGFARTKKKLILNKEYRSSIYNRLKEIASNHNKNNIRNFMHSFQEVDFNISLPIVLSQLKIIDEFYASCAPEGPCIFLSPDGCIIHETKEFKCEAYYCAASSYKGNSENLQQIIRKNFTAADVFRLHINDLSVEEFIDLVRLEISIFKQLPRLESSVFLEPKIIISSNKIFEEVTYRLENILEKFKIINEYNDINTLNNLFFQYFHKKYFDKDLAFIFRSDETNLSAIRKVQLHQTFPSSLFLTKPLKSFFSAEEEPFSNRSHFSLAKSDLYSIKR